MQRREMLTALTHLNKAHDAVVDHPTLMTSADHSIMDAIDEAIERLLTMMAAEVDAS